tara:strand:- start:220 stop:933 length:714 start_codon:yes stop_codon:yes gene_type:complete
MINSLSLYLSQYQELFGDDLFIKNKKNKNKKKLINNLISSIIESSHKSHFDKDLLNNLFTNIKSCNNFLSNNNDMNFIFGMGDDNSDIVFISESPGCLNNPQELLFLGDASKLFDKMLSAVNLKRENIYLLNILKTNFKNESKFNINDTDACNLKNYIYENLQLVKPKVIIFLGDSIYKKIIKKENNFEDLRKKVFKFLNVDCLMTYHPNMLIRKNELKKNAWEDFKILRDNYLNDK